MKRELAALEPPSSAAAAADHDSRITRSAKSASLVYKRLKRSSSSSLPLLKLQPHPSSIGPNDPSPDALIHPLLSTVVQVSTKETHVPPLASHSLQEGGYTLPEVTEVALLTADVDKLVSDEGGSNVLQLDVLNSDCNPPEKQALNLMELTLPANEEAKIVQEIGLPVEEEAKIVAETSLPAKEEEEPENLMEVSLAVEEECLFHNQEELREVSVTLSDGNLAIVDIVQDPVSLKSPVNGKRKKKNAAGEGFTRRFTRSALKPVDTVKVQDVVDENTKVEKEVVSGSNNVHVDREEALLEVQVSGENEIHGEGKIGKAKEDGTDSCVTETSDSVVPDKEVGVSHNENGECDVMDKLVEDETMSSSPLRKSEVKMSKQVAVSRIPTTVKELFETGLLEGCPVYYDGGKGPGLRGRIRAIGILCPCNSCLNSKVIPPSLFEIHANNTYKRAVQYIYLENGRSFIQILKACKATRLKTLEATVLNAIGPLPERKLIVCQNCKELYSTMDTECLEPVCTSCIMSNLSPTGPVYSSRKMCRSGYRTWSSDFVSPQAAEAGDMPQGRSLYKSVRDIGQKKSAAKSGEAFRTPKVRISSRMGRSTEIAKNSEDVFLAPKTCRSPEMGKSLATKTCKKSIKKSLKSALSPKPSGLTVVGKSSPKGGYATKRVRKELLTPKVSKTPSVHSSEKKTSGKITRKDLRLHKLVFEDDVLPDGTELGYYARGQKLLDGFKKGSGIFCNCCETVISASQFEAHAGCASRRKPYCYIYTSNGVSLHELSINLIKGRRQSVKFNDDLCSICADGGSLLLCDGCPRAFHTECASLSSIPRGKWYCKYCENMFEREKFVAHNANAVAAGRVSGVDPIEQITKRSIQMVHNIGSEVSSCILCRGFDFCKSGFGPRTIILCDQCEKEYHVGCLKDHNMADLTELPDGKWFCGMDCGRIESALQNLLVRGAERLPQSLVNIITRKDLQNGSEGATGFDVSWRLLSGKIASPETRPLLSQAVAIFHESFAPIIDVVSGHDLIPAMVYGRNVGGQEYGGMYCAVLTINSVVVSAGIFRIFGPEVAELPLVATSSGNHGKGYFQTLFACIERLLAFLKVKSFVLPAAEEAESIWTERFGFMKMTPDQLRELKRNFWSMVRFQGTSMLHKAVPECRVVQSPAEL